MEFIMLVHNSSYINKEFLNCIPFEINQILFRESKLTIANIVNTRKSSISFNIYSLAIFYGFLYIFIIKFSLSTFTWRLK
jgi:hypothetical protein